MEHFPPPPDFIAENKLAEPEGERLRAELTAWMQKNKIVSIFMPTEHHEVRIDIDCLPQRTKTILSNYGSIRVEDTDYPEEFWKDVDHG